MWFHLIWCEPVLSFSIRLELNCTVSFDPSWFLLIWFESCRSAPDHSMQFDLTPLGLAWLHSTCFDAMRHTELHRHILLDTNQNTYPNLLTPTHRHIKLSQRWPSKRTQTTKQWNAHKETYTNKKRPQNTCSISLVYFDHLLCTCLCGTIQVDIVVACTSVFKTLI